MKKFLPILLATSLLLSACGIGWNNKEDLFQRKQNCLKYKNEISKTIKDRINTLAQWKDKYTHEEDFLEVFYSPIKNSCLYAVRVTEVQDGLTCVDYQIHDYLSSSLVNMYLEMKKNNPNECDTTATEVKYYQALKELKWE